MDLPDAICVTTTTDAQAQAQAIAAALVERRLAACVQVLGPIQSTYWWEDELATAEEWQCVAKTTRERYADVENAIRELHAYDEPEIIATPIVAGSAGYLDWMKREVSR